MQQIRGRQRIKVPSANYNAHSFMQILYH